MKMNGTATPHCESDRYTTQPASHEMVRHIKYFAYDTELEYPDCSGSSRKRSGVKKYAIKAPRHDELESLGELWH